MYDKYGALRGVPAEGVAENAGRRLERGGDFPLLYGELKKKEKYIGTYVYSEVKIVENKIVSFNKFDKTTTSFRVYKDGLVGVHFQQGKMTDKEG